MGKRRMEDVQVEDGICAYGGWKMCKWRMEDVQLEDGRCLGGVWKMFRWRIEDAHVEDGRCSAVQVEDGRRSGGG